MYSLSKLHLYTASSSITRPSPSLWPATWFSRSVVVGLILVATLATLCVLSITLLTQRRILYHSSPALKEKKERCNRVTNIAKRRTVNAQIYRQISTKMYTPFKIRFSMRISDTDPSSWLLAKVTQIRYKTFDYTDYGSTKDNQLERQQPSNR